MAVAPAATGCTNMTAAPSLRFRGRARIDGQPLFPDIDLPIAAAKWTCLLGPSGVGKTTILRLIAGLSCAVDFTGQITTSDGHPSMGRVAYMAQSDLLFPWLDVHGNIGLGARLRGERPDQAHMRDVIARTGLADHLRKRPSELSGGQRQRTALARTLMEDRPIILLDEPFSALDARTRAEMQELTVELLAGRTVLLVTHDPAEAARLAHGAHVLMPERLHPIDLPDTPIARAIDDPATIRAQSQMLGVLRQVPA